MAPAPPDCNAVFTVVASPEGRQAAADRPARVAKGKMSVSFIFVNLQRLRSSAYPIRRIAVCGEKIHGIYKLFSFAYVYPGEGEYFMISDQPPRAQVRVMVTQDGHTIVRAAGTSLSLEGSEDYTFLIVS